MWMWYVVTSPLPVAGPLQLQDGQFYRAFPPCWPHFPTNWYQLSSKWVKQEAIYEWLNWSNIWKPLFKTRCSLRLKIHNYMTSTCLWYIWRWYRKRRANNQTSFCRKVGVPISKKHDEAILNFRCRHVEAFEAMEIGALPQQRVNRGVKRAPTTVQSGEDEETEKRFFSFACPNPQLTVW